MQAEIVGIIKIPSTDTSRRGQMDTMVQVQTDPGGITVVTIPKDTNDAKEIETFVIKELKARNMAIGHKFKIP